MGRKKRAVVVEGAVLDLTGEEPVVVMGELVETPVVVTGTVVETPPVTKEDDERRLTNITPEDLRDIILSMRQKCKRCGEEEYFDMRIWGDEKVCPTCYRFAFREHCRVFNEWLREEGIKECAFCRKPRTNPSEFHFDHVNMFDKESSVGIMLFEGANMDAIKEESKKCQLLCVRCHFIVTRMEVRLGFTYLKRKKRRETGVKQEDYMPVMTRVYDLIKEIRGAGGGDGTK
jgi:hypothetical protein